METDYSLRIAWGDQIEMKELIGYPGLEFCGLKCDSDRQYWLLDLQIPEKQQIIPIGIEKVLL